MVKNVLTYNIFRVYPRLPTANNGMASSSQVVSSVVDVVVVDIPVEPDSLPVKLYQEVFYSINKPLTANREDLRANSYSAR